MNWRHSEWSSVREDGAKVTADWLTGKLSWWAYPKGWTARGNVAASGPWATREDAIASLDSVLVMG